MVIDPGETSMANPLRSSNAPARPLVALLQLPVLAGAGNQQGRPGVKLVFQSVRLICQAAVYCPLLQGSSGALNYNLSHCCDPTILDAASKTRLDKTF